MHGIPPPAGEKLGEEPVQKPFQRLSKAGKLIAVHVRRLLTCIDTFKDKLILDDLYARRQVPWEVWKRPVQ